MPEVGPKLQTESRPETNREISDYLSGSKLFGDDASPGEIEQWYRDEEHAYWQLAAGSNTECYSYAYDQLNQAHAFRYLRHNHFPTALAFGCASGADVAPLAPQVDRFIAIEPARHFWSGRIGEKPTEWVAPDQSGTINLSDDSVDLIVCLGVLHHIPNVSYVMAEFARVLAPSGYLVLREPTISMGDWRVPRPGLTKRERGIPLAILLRILLNHSFRVLRKRHCLFPAVMWTTKVGCRRPYNNPVLTAVDTLLSHAFSWNKTYHRDHPLKKLGPTSIFLTARLEA